MTDTSRYCVPADELRWRCDPDQFGFETTAELECCKEIFGQDRALDAIRLGLEITSPGYNIYVSGLTGTGKSTTIQTLMRSMQHEKKSLLDLCYVYNFLTPEEPRYISLPAGEGAELKERVADVLATLREHIPAILESESFSKRRNAITSRNKNQRSLLIQEFENEIQAKGFQLLEMQYGPFTQPVIVPVVKEQPVEMEALAAQVADGKLDQKAYEKIQTDHDALGARMQELLKTTRDLDRSFAREIDELQKEFVRPVVDTCIDEVRERFPQERVLAFLTELRRYVIDHVDRFADAPEREGKPEAGDGDSIEFEVNVIVSHGAKEEVPVVIETVPTHRNVFGTIEQLVDARGATRADFTMIRAGSLLRAHGGFLVVNVVDMFEEPTVWPALKRALKNQSTSIQGPESGMMSWTSALKPQPIDVDVKVVLIGDLDNYHYLYSYDEDFRKIFKVKAEFDTDMPNNDENVKKYGQFIRNLAEDEVMLPFHKNAVAAIAEHGAWLATRQDRLSTRFSDVADVIREACYWAGKDGADVVGREHVTRSLRERMRRVDLPEEKMDEMLAEGTILIDLHGKEVGQVNGLAVHDVGDHSFGRPVRITVETSLGRTGIVSIEREAELSGKTYNKGTLILEGYLRRQFAQSRPLTMNASIGFEQFYAGIDGDSASSTEVYGILSSLADVPLRQDLAVTGSVNQKGELQPIGGVNEKIEGFFGICKIKGLTGTQGVVVPVQNRVDLMLRDEVVEAVRAGQFHIYAVKTIEEGISVLTGVPAGARDSHGEYEADTVFALVEEKLARFAEELKAFEAGDDKEEAHD